MKKFKRILASVVSAMVLVSSLPATAVNAETDEVAIVTDTPYKMQLTSNGETVIFTPEYDSWYKFYSTGSWDTYATLFGPDEKELVTVDDTNDNHNFLINYKLYANNTYYLSVGAFIDDSQTAEVTITVEESIGVEDVVISKEPDIPTVVEGYEEDTLDCSGLEVVFTMSNGSTVNWSYNEDNNVGEGYVDVSVGDDGVGHYYVDITCEDAYTRYFFTTVENTVDYITYSGTPIEYYENSHGYYSDEDAQYYYYYDLPSDATITVYYTDGTYVTSPVSDKVKEAYAKTDDNQSETPWVKGSTNYITLSYLGAETKIPVTIVESPIASIEILSHPTVREYENYYYPVFNGMKIRVTDKQGVSNTVTLSDENTEYIAEGTLTYAFTAGDKPFNIYYEYDLSLGEIYVLHCQGTEVKYANFSFTETRDVSTLSVDNVTPNGDNMVVTVSYSDNTSEALTLDVLDYNDYGNGSYEGYAMTANGIAYYSIDAVYENNRVAGYNFSILDKSVYVEAPDYKVGDVDQDGIITICDATAIQLYLIDKQELDFTQEYAADVNNDGSITIDDVTTIQLYVARLINSFD